MSSQVSLDAAFRGLASAIILQALHDAALPQWRTEATAFLASPECRSLARVVGLRWNVTPQGLESASARVQRKRRRHCRRKDYV